MAEIASHLLDFPPANADRLSPEEYDKRIKTFYTSLANISPSKLAAVDGDRDLLEVIDPTTNTISYAFVLRSRIESQYTIKNKSTQVENAIVQKAILFLNNFDPLQARYLRDQLKLFAEWLCKQVKSRANLHQHAVAAVRSSILRLDPSGGTLTSSHHHFLDLCLATRSFRAALPVLDRVVYSFPANKATTTNIDGRFACSDHTDSSSFITESSGLTTRLDASDVHEYYLMGAMIYIGLRQWKDALLYLECVLASPTSGQPTGLMVEAYQKWVLVECIVNGRVADASKIMNQATSKVVKGCSKAYDSLAQIFARQETRHLRAEISAGTSIWFEDGNSGLVQELVTSMPRFSVINMQKVYSALPLSTVAEWLEQALDQTHAFIENLIVTGALNASIELRNGPDQGAVLRFYSNRGSGPNSKSEQELTANLVEQTRRTNEMMGHVKLADRRLVLTKEYIDGLRKRMRSKEEDGPANMDGLENNPEWSAYQDEDIMIDA